MQNDITKIVTQKRHVKTMFQKCITEKLMREIE